MIVGERARLIATTRGHFRGALAVPKVIDLLPMTLVVVLRVKVNCGEIIIGQTLVKKVLINFL